jgi:hypothetical protein
MSAQQDPLAALRAKQTSPDLSGMNQPGAPAPQGALQTAPAAAPDDADTDQGDSTEPADEATAGKVNLLRQYSKMNAAITALFDGLGVHRSLTVPHQEGQDMAGHINDVGKAIAGVGGLTTNFLLATHTKHDPQGGATVAFTSEKLRQTIIPVKSEAAKNAVDACRTLINKVSALLPDNPPEILRAKSQIALVAKTEMANMSAFDAGVFLIAVTHPLFQLLARRHSGTKKNGHSVQLRAPEQEAPQTEQ